MADETEDGTEGQAPNVIDLAAAREQVKRDIERGTFDAAKDEKAEILKEMNDKHAYIVSYYGKPAITMKVFSHIYGKEILEFHNADSISLTYGNQTVMEGRTRIELGKWWIKHYERKQYTTVFFDPVKPKEYNNCLNLWEGMNVQPAKGNWKPVLAHIYRILCNRDTSKFTYTLKWIAWTLQNPGIRAEVAIIFKGKEGAGKGFIFTQLVKVFGEHGMSISSREHLTGKFNAHLGRTVFLFADEAYYPGDKDVEGVLKQLITEERIPTEAKFRDVGLARNFLHIAMSTNQDWVIPAHDDSRRYFINQVDNRYAKGQTTDAARTTYFSTLWNCMDNGGREAMVYDLLQMDLTGWRPRDNVPSTGEMLHQIALSLPKLEKTVLNFINEGTFPGKLDSLTNYRVTADELYHSLEKLHGDSLKISTVKVMQLFKKLGAEKHKTSKFNYWVLPELGEFKKNWESIYGKYPWDTPDDKWRLDQIGY